MLGLEDSKNYGLLFSPTELFAVEKTYRPHPSGKGAGYDIMTAIHVMVNPASLKQPTIRTIPAGSDKFYLFTEYLTGRAKVVGLPMKKKGKGSQAYYTAPEGAIVATPSEGQMMEFVRVLEGNGMIEDVSKYVLAPMLTGKAISPSDERAAGIEAQISNVIEKGMKYVEAYNDFADKSNISVTAKVKRDTKALDDAEAAYVNATKELDELFEKDEEQKRVEAERLAARKEREARTMPPSSSSSSSSAAPPSLLSGAPQSTSSSSSGPAAAGAPQNGQARRKKTRRSPRKKRTTRRR